MQLSLGSKGYVNSYLHEFYGRVKPIVIGFTSSPLCPGFFLVCLPAAREEVLHPPLPDQYGREPPVIRFVVS